MICLLVRVVEALGATALITSSFAIIANTFPDSVTAMFVRTTSTGVPFNPERVCATTVSAGCYSCCVHLGLITIGCALTKP